jgi:hypothetical protein
VAVSADGACWFCGEAAAEGDRFQVGLHRDSEVRHYVVVAQESWSRTGVDVPRCRRCRVGHTLELVLLVVGIPAFLWGAGLVIDGAFGLAGATLGPGKVALAVGFALPLAAYFGLRWRLPRPRRHVRRHPEVAALLADGWRYGRAPLHQWNHRMGI